MGISQNVSAAGVTTSLDIPDLTGRHFVVTGANSGLGLATTRVLAGHGAHVVLAVRDEAKGRAAVRALTAEGKGGGRGRGGGGGDGRGRGVADRLDVRRLDLADLDSVREFAAALRADYPKLDVLIDNAGVMAPPYTRSAQGHELQFAVNHLGHFALTGLLLDRLAAGREPRVVTVSSVQHRKGRIHFEALEAGAGGVDGVDGVDGERGAGRYSPMGWYNQSKLANAVFGHELHRRLTAAGSLVRSLLAHPGYASTHLQADTPVALVRLVFGRLLRPLFAQSPEAGALPQLYAATAPDVESGAFFGPDGPGELRGAPKRVALAPAATDAEMGRRLWELSERLTGVRYEFG
ncbi:SDR family NAD(P)-dependent oxidoreductase [Streptomyces sp. NPDC046203]|uniref:SDR family NAD(P)-dependent oxidoreductase n=1 Tax=Streptomyces sp. NPDC046203 TaxID=3154602 RepID=UPI0033EAECC6